MIRTILIDDEALARDIVKHYLKAFLNGLIYQKDSEICWYREPNTHQILKCNLNVLLW